VSSPLVRAPGAVVLARHADDVAAIEALFDPSGILDPGKVLQ